MAKDVLPSREHYHQICRFLRKEPDYEQEVSNAAYAIFRHLQIQNRRQDEEKRSDRDQVTEGK